MSLAQRGITGKPKFSIQSFKQGSSNEQNNSKVWMNNLSRAIDEIYNQNASQLSFEELYRSAYNMCLNKQGDALYSGITDSLTLHVRKSAAKISGTSKEELLRVNVKEWEYHQVAFRLVRDVLMYMDRTYCTAKKKLTAFELALMIYRNEVIFHTNIRQRLRDAILEEIAHERAGRIVDRDILKTTLHLYQVLTAEGHPLYDSEFERHFLQVTADHYQIESLSYLTTNTCSEYILKAEEMLSQEHERVINYLSSSTEPKLRSLLEKELIDTHCIALIEMESSGLFVMFRENRVDDLRRMYNLFCRLNVCLDALREYLTKYIVQRGQEIVNQSTTTATAPVVTENSSSSSSAAVAATVAPQNTNFVQALLDLKLQFDTIIKVAFRDEKKCQLKLKEAFELFVNKDNRCASQLANYMDEILRSAGSNQGLSDLEIENKLDRSILIFKYLADKDIFENYYRKLFAKRLLSQKSSSDELEKSVISKLKTECGYQFTSKLEGMLMDMNTSKTTQEDYRRSTYAARLSIDLEISLLTAGYWPFQSSSSGMAASKKSVTDEINVLCKLPTTMFESCLNFQQFYTERNSGRKLQWAHNMGHVEMKAFFPSGRRELTVSVFQACMLILFNKKATWTLEEIANATEIHTNELRRHLLSLCTPKMKILVKSSKGKGIEADDNFTFNAEFNSKLKRIKVPLIAMKEVTGENDNGMNNCDALDAIPMTVEEDRRHLVEAAIVRIMKSRKTLGHNDLIAEVTRQLNGRFVPAPQFIKKRIESLIEREYLVRNADDARLYNYVA